MTQDTVYMNTKMVTAQQWDGSRESAKKLGIELPSEEAIEKHPMSSELMGTVTLNGKQYNINPHDWLVKHINSGDRWVVSDNIFWWNYQSVPIVPQFVVDYILGHPKGEVTLTELLNNLATGAVGVHKTMRDWYKTTYDSDSIIATLWLNMDLVLVSTTDYKEDHRG